MHTPAAKFVKTVPDSDLSHMKSAFRSHFSRLARPVFFCPALALLCASACVTLPRRAADAGTTETARAESDAARAAVTPLVNINRATREELERLPSFSGSPLDFVLLLGGVTEEPPPRLYF